jgi:hypothetical protein
MSPTKKKYQINDRVYAKMKGFPFWPARVMKLFS